MFCLFLVLGASVAAYGAAVHAHVNSLTEVQRYRIAVLMIFQKNSGSISRGQYVSVVLRRLEPHSFHARPLGRGLIRVQYCDFSTQYFFGPMLV